MDTSGPSSSSSSDEGLLMGGRYLSKEVMCKILGRLPVRSLLTLRAVCRRWNSILDDVEFQSISEQIQTPTVRRAQGAPFLLWDTDSSKPLLSLVLTSRKWRPFHLFQSCSITVISSARGLFFTQKFSVVGKSMSVLNPLTKAERQLPDIDWSNFDARQMVVDDMGLGQYFIIAEELQKRNVTGELLPHTPRLQIYDSLKRNWQLCEGFPEGVRFRNAVALNGHLLCLTHSRIGSRNVGLYKYNGRGLMEVYGLDVPVCIGPTFRQWIPRLFGSRGRLMLIGETDTCGRGVFVWKLIPSSYKWELVQKMPNDLFEDSVGSYEFLACDDYICVHPCRGEKNRAIIGYLATGLWHVVPAIAPALSSTRSSFIYDSFCFFEPRVGARV